MSNSHAVCGECGGDGCEKCHNGWACTGAGCNKCAMGWKLGESNERGSTKRYYYDWCLTWWCIVVHLLYTTYGIFGDGQQ